jgi:hypothetical protein
MTMTAVVKENPFAFLGTGVTIIALVTALFTIDSRYAHSAEVAKDKQQTQQLIVETTKNLRKQSLEDKLFELDIKKETAVNQRLSPVDAALRERYDRQLKELNQK